MKQASGKDGKTEDPYINGPVKNRIIKGYVSIKECYSKYLNGNHQKKEGNINVDWQIDTDGKVLLP